MFKRLFVIFSLLLLGISFIPPNAQAATSGCCVLTFEYRIKGVFFRNYIKGKLKKTQQFTNVSKEKCRTAPYTTEIGYLENNFTSLVDKNDGFYTENLERDCGSNEKAHTTYSSSYCCVAGRGIVSHIKSVGTTVTFGLYTDAYSKAKQDGSLTCTSVPNGQTSCAGGKLEKKACNAVAACAQSKKAFKQNLDTTKGYQQELQKIKQQILDSPVPQLGTEFPGNKKLNSIELIDGAGGSAKSNNSGITYIAIPWIGQLIQWFYQYAIGIGGIVATVMIMVGGFMWILSGGDAGRVSVAKNYIKNAALGLILLMTAYMILNFVNPDFVNLRSIYIEIPSVSVRQGNFPQCQINPNDKGVTQIEGKYYCANFSDTSKYVNLATNPEKDKLTNVKPPGKSIAYVTKNLYTALQAANDDLKKINPNYKLRISSSSRAMNDQSRYCNCWESYKASNYKICPAGCGSCNQAAIPNCSKGSRHLRGIAIDVGLIGPDLSCGSLSMAYNCASHVRKTGKNKKILDQNKKCEGNKVTKPDPKCVGAGKTGCKDVTMNKYQYCQDLMHALLTKHGFSGISDEWWHHNYLK